MGDSLIMKQCIKHPQYLYWDKLQVIEDEHGFKVGCYVEDCGLETEYYPTALEAAKAWNKRDLTCYAPVKELEEIAKRLAELEKGDKVE